MEIPEKINECVQYIQKQCDFVPETGIILGTGLGGLISSIDSEYEFAYESLPHFAHSTVETHAGKLIFGKLEGKNIVCMQGRFHFYEGWSMEEITFPIRVMHALGIKNLIVSNAAGAINPLFKAGDLMLLTDHINLLGTNPLIGKHFNSFGARWPDMSEPYNQNLLEITRKVALEQNIPLQNGVYACMSGPSLETKAEYRMLKILGADAIGMSTVPEVIVGVQCGLNILGMSVLTDECFPDALEVADISKIIANAQRAEPKMVQLIRGVLTEI